MTIKMVIKNTQNADSRTANDELTKETLHEATVIHRADVQQLMEIIGEMIIERGADHDFTKIISDLDYFSFHFFLKFFLIHIF